MVVAIIVSVYQSVNTIPYAKEKKDCKPINPDAPQTTILPMSADVAEWNVLKALRKKLTEYEEIGDIGIWRSRWYGEDLGVIGYECELDAIRKNMKDIGQDYNGEPNFCTYLTKTKKPYITDAARERHFADYFNEKYGERPSVRLNNPDLIFHIHIAGEECTLALDSSGESLHRRGYRVETGRAPINEVLAAGMIMLTNWHGECDFIDPMCGSGTLPIEAALIARNIAPGVFRQGYAFEKWKDYDSALFKSIYEDDSAEREFKHKIYGYDVDGRMVACARRNVKSAMMNDCIEIECRDIKDFEEHSEPAIMIVNPPYGERLVPDKLLQVYKDLGARLKHAFQGNVAWVISNNYDCFDQIGLKASARIPLFNGDLDCEFRKYELFQGKYKGFRGEGNELKKDYAPLKRQSRLTGLDGETRTERAAKNQNNDANYSSEIDDESMRRRRELEAYFSKARRKPARRERTEGEGERRERREGGAPRDDRRAPRENRRDDRFTSREGRGRDDRRAPRGERRDDRFTPREGRERRDERRAPRENREGGKNPAGGRKPFERKGAGKSQAPYKNGFKPLRGGKRDDK